ncbi:helix-turn-helix transcriptional regulator [Pseudonocardia sp. Cha107L01]|uniref:helix-turn-helix transcriptional regulator n=1 Tax=Pseudonocardia sp. Cha107L01 TaxID=3457576 RepID=UPI00403ECE47
MPVRARLDRYRGGVPVYRYVPEPQTPPVQVLRFEHEDPHPGDRPHIHDFPALVYVARDSEPPPTVRAEAGRSTEQPGTAQPGTAQPGTEQWWPRAGDLYLVAPGNVVRRPVTAFRRTGATAVFFAPEAVSHEGTRVASWRSHPLLFPFLHGTPTGLLRLRVPAAERADWSRTIGALETELAEHRDGYRQAALAHLTLLLVSVARLAGDVLGDLRRSDEPLLAEVFGVIERRYGGPLSLRDVAAEVRLSAGHLTTSVRRKTGRTVQDWITERRMSEARRLLVETDLPLAEVGRRVGYPDGGYFARVFRREHGVAPRAWRAAR